MTNIEKQKLSAERLKTNRSPRTSLDFLSAALELFFTEEWGLPNAETFKKLAVSVIRKKSKTLLQKTFLVPKNGEFGDIIKLIPGAELTIHFRGNKAGSYMIGLGDILPRSVKWVQVLHHGKSRTGERKISFDNVYYRRMREGYFDINGYIPVFEGDMVRIKESVKNKQPPLSEAKPKRKASSDTVPKKKREGHSSSGGRSQREEAYNRLQEQDGLKEKRETPAHFVERATVIAKEVQKVYGVPWQATVLTACLESGYGKHAPNNNYFGIKSAGRKGRYWRGDSGSFQTREFLNGRSVTMRDGFRAYDNMIDSFFDYGEFLTTNARYAKAFHYKNDPKRFLEEIIRAGYATDPDYVQKVTSIARRYGISLNTSDYRLA